MTVCSIFTVVLSRVRENSPRKFQIRVKVSDGNFGGIVTVSYLIPDEVIDLGYPDPEEPTSSHLHNGQMVSLPGVNRPELGVKLPPFSNA